jgi:hypothetical protein
MRPLKPLATLNLSLLAAGFLFLSPQIFAMEQAPSASPAPIRVDGTNVWFDIRQFGVEGRGWNDTKDFYDRLPARAEGLVRKPVWDLSHDSAGNGAKSVCRLAELNNLAGRQSDSRRLIISIPATGEPPS